MVVHREAEEETADRAGAEFAETIQAVQEYLTLGVMQELNARVEVDREKPAEVAAQYLREFGYVR